MAPWSGSIGTTLSEVTHVLFRIGIVLACVSWFGGYAQADITLVENGQARAKIYVTPAVMAANQKTVRRPAVGSDDETERQRQRLRDSVLDLAHYLQKIGGAEIEIVTEPPNSKDDTVAILIGDLATQAVGAPKQAAPYKQGFRYTVSPGRVALCGESDLATSYAIYELLDRLGCRWYMPSEMGEVIPQLKTITLAETDLSSAPGTIYRGIWYADEAYQRRNRMGGPKLSFKHGLEGYVTKEQRQEHPEWVGVVNGKPHPRRLKWSNPAVADAIAQRLLADQSKRPVDSISLSPDDGIDFDNSAEDKAIDAGDLDTTTQAVSLTDRLMVICNRVAEQVHKQYPEVIFGVLAYGPTNRPPVREKVHPSIAIQLAPISYSRAHPMTDDRVPDNKQYRALVEGWSKAVRLVSVRFYAWFLFEASAPNPMITKWSIDVPFCLEHGGQIWQPETQPNFETSMHGIYLGNRLAWNPQLKPAEIIDELNTKFYGHAARQMTDYWNFIDEVWVTTPEYSGCGFGHLRRWTPERMARARELMNAGLAAAKTPVEQERIQLANESLKLFELFIKLRRDQAEGRFETLAADADRWRQTIQQLADKYRDQYTFTRKRNGKETLAGNEFESYFQRTYRDATRIAKDFQILSPQPLRNFRYQPDADKKGPTGGEALGWFKPDFDDSDWKTTDVCVETWSSIGFHSWFKSMWYRTTVKLPVQSSTDKKTFLWIGCTDGSAKVFVNGVHVPFAKTFEEFRGFCQPVAFDITSALSPSGENQISILCTRMSYYELGTGGLMGPVMIYREK